MYFFGRPCAEKKMWASDGVLLASHLVAMRRARALTYPSRLYHAGMTTLRTCLSD